jgi:hypothetical protein
MPKPSSRDGFIIYDITVQNTKERDLAAVWISCDIKSGEGEKRLASAGHKWDNVRRSQELTFQVAIPRPKNDALPYIDECTTGFVELS